MHYQLLSLRHLSKAESDELLNQESFGKDYLEVIDMIDDLEGKEKKPLTDRELRSQIVRLAIEAYRREEISRGRLLDVGKALGMSGAKLIALGEAARAD